MKEVWKDVMGYEGLYQVSNLGRIKSLNFHRQGKERILRPIIDIGGYEVVKLCLNGNIRRHRVHRLVCEHFVPNLENKPYVDHIDANRRNNDMRNLHWCTTRENHNNPLSLLNHGKATHDAWEKGLHKNNIKAVLQCDTNGNVVREFKSISAAAKSAGCSHHSIWICLKHPDKNLTAMGSKWKLK